MVKKDKFFKKVDFTKSMKTELEQLLEGGLAELGVKFSPRVTGREIRDSVLRDPISLARIQRIHDVQRQDEYLEATAKLMGVPDADLNRLKIAINMTLAEDTL